jgi:CRP-like cAMP-binding protein
METLNALVWENFRFVTLREQFPKLRNNLGGILTNRLGELETRLCELAYCSARQRLAKSLLRLVAQISLDGSNSCSVRITQDELGKLTGLTVFTISRLLSNWSSTGVLQQGRASLLIRNVSKLEQLSHPSSLDETSACVPTDRIGSGFSESGRESESRPA